MRFATVTESEEAFLDLKNELASMEVDVYHPGPRTNFNSMTLRSTPALFTSCVLFSIEFSCVFTDSEFSTLFDGATDDEASCTWKPLIIAFYLLLCCKIILFCFNPVSCSIIFGLFELVIAQFSLNIVLVAQSQSCWSLKQTPERCCVDWERPEGRLTIWNSPITLRCNTTDI